MTPPGWLAILAVVALVVAGLSAAFVLWDICSCKRQIMPVMKWVRPITALYLGPIARWAWPRSDNLSPIAFEIGLFGWMALSAFVFFNHELHPDHPVYWFMIQVGMAIGFATSFPMNWWLIKRGLKEKR